ncbi:helix-turn-helix domain-containing protein [Halomicrobium salinisoli]|uniref:helix-turn-helix domain-containing protein n=1 Tax=Halomicrobium salinisoli TaxID=2878391 RepID=UPI001CF04C86|nr:helix-turn-helix domain-containing protein [Halomicrobium salinisoli]
MEKDTSKMANIEESFRWLFGKVSMPRYRAEWMTRSDDVILEFLEDTGAGHNLQGIANNFQDRNIEISYTTLTRRLPKLEEAGLVRILPGQGKYYAITEEGEAYLRGDADLRGESEPDA